jgi:ribosomal protein L37E
MSKSYIKCSECGTVNYNNEYCSNCNALLDIALKRRIESENKIQQKIEQERSKEPNKVEVFLKNGLEHSNVIIRFFFKAGYDVWLFFAVIIGGIIAAVTAAAAG